MFCWSGWFCELELYLKVPYLQARILNGQYGGNYWFFAKSCRLYFAHPNNLLICNDLNAYGLLIESLKSFSIWNLVLNYFRFPQVAVSESQSGVNPEEVNPPNWGRINRRSIPNQGFQVDWEFKLWDFAESYSNFWHPRALIKIKLYARI